MGSQKKRAAGQGGEVPIAQRPAGAAPPAAFVGDGSAVVGIYDRPMDAVYSLIYVLLAMVAVAPLLFSSSACRHVLPEEELGVKGICANYSVTGPIISNLIDQWHQASPASPHKASKIALFLLRIDLAANLLLAPFLAVVMFRGALRSAWQVPAVIHLTIVAISNGAIAVTSSGPQSITGKFALWFFVGIPLVLLRRWWCDWPFAIKTVKPKRKPRLVWRLYNFLLAFAVLAWVVITSLHVWDWAVSSHQDLKHLPKTVPALGRAATQAAAMASQGAEACGAAIGDLAEKAGPAAKEGWFKTSTALQDGLSDLGARLQNTYKQYAG
eukprot:TRINITY_DN16695_c0_g1_i1.p2 TRINITY_DN16695_c0_g1~~TRINITY_DN16695_c0_g1_i1.p2  ORF type:complete len:363 (+),score=123.86 TRINITY_DN16695_c0_g1_i1:112-1089(+)